jgi:SAM-dependent methyltransferase
VIPELSDLAECLTRPGSRFLDVGVGVGALAIAMCEQFPALSVVGLDVMARVLDLARSEVAAHGLADRIELRLLDVASLRDIDGYDLAWLPAPFISPPSLRAALPRIHAALHPGGWLLLSMERADGAPLSVAVTMWRTTLLGGTVMPPSQAIADLIHSGFSEVIQIPTPSSAPVILAARRQVRAD